jgi:acyl-CoA hydrolase
MSDAPMSDAPMSDAPMSDAPRRERRTVKESRHETSEIMMPHNANILGPVFGGAILAMMDKTAAVAAIRHARRSCVTVSIDRVDFREPIHVGDLVVMHASVNYAGRTSMEVGVRVEAEDMISGYRRHTNSAYLTFVAVDGAGRPVEVPELVPETAEERRRYAAAQERRRRRLEERTAEAEAVAAHAAAQATDAAANDGARGR